MLSRKVLFGNDFEAELVVLLVELVRDVGGDVPFVEEQPVGIDAPVDGVLLHLGQVLLLLLVLPAIIRVALVLSRRRLQFWGGGQVADGRR